MPILQRALTLICVFSLAISSCSPRAAADGENSAGVQQTASETSTTQHGRTKVDASAVLACAKLAAGPLEVADGRAGLTLDNMLSGAAVDACESAVAYDASDAANWRRLARAHTAEVIVRDLPPAVHLVRARVAMERAARLGDPLARVQTVLWPSFGQTMDREETPAIARELLREMEARPAASVEDAFARVMVEAVLLHYEPIPEPASGGPLAYYKVRQEKLASSQAMNSLRAAVRQSSWGVASGFQHDLHLMDYCNGFLTLCSIFDTGLNTSGDPAAMLEVAAQWMQRADTFYRRGRMLANPTTPKPAEFYRAERSALVALRLANLAIETGDSRQAEAATGLRQASLGLRRDMKNDEAAARNAALVNQQNADGAAILAFFGAVALAYAVASGSDGAATGSAQKYADTAARERCNWAQSIVMFPDGANRDTLQSARFHANLC